MKLNKAVAALCTVGLIGGFGSAHAGSINLSNWQINLGLIGATAAGYDNFTGFGVFGQTTGGVKGIDEMSFDSIFHSVTVSGGVFPFPAPGDLDTVDTLGQITQAKNASGSVNRTTTIKRLNEDFELTFTSTTTQLITSFPDIDGNQTNQHLGAGTGPVGLARSSDNLSPLANGYLNVYADRIDGAAGLDVIGATANTSQFTGGGGMNDGLLIATFRVLPAAGNSGNFNNSPAALDGSDDASFELVWQYSVAGVGVLQDSLGISLALGSTLGLTDSNIDGDPDGNQVIDTAPTGYAPLGSGLGSCGSTAFSICGVENGSFILATQVPEPGTMTLLGLSLLGLSGLRRRRS